MTSESLGVVVSLADEASVHVGDRLRAMADWSESDDDTRPSADGGGTVYRRPGVELRTFADRHLDLVGVADAFDDPSLVAFASRHAGETGRLLTAHHTGNFGPADHGGSDRTLARAAPNAHRRVLASLAEYAPEGYDVGMECTHHGPTDVGAPSLFVEVGSEPEAWDDPDAAMAVARAILDLADRPADAPAENGTRRHLVGFGGGHYAPRFGRIVRETDWSVGHVAADWALEAMGDPENADDVIAAAFEESAAEYALFAADRPELAGIVRDLGYRTVGETWVRETSGVPLPLVEILEAAVGTVEAGLRFGDPARVDTDCLDDPAVGRVHDDLVSAVNGVGRDATLAAVDGVALAYDTADNGSRFAGPVALGRAADEDTLVARLVEVLESGYDAVERSDDDIVVRRREFDPDLAQSAGVSPGPAFGRLAEGESVTVDGDVVTPDDVTVERERTLPASVLED